MRETVLLALAGSLMMAAASPLAPADDGQPVPDQSIRAAGDAVSMEPLPVYVAEARTGQPARFWAI